VENAELPIGVLVNLRHNKTQKHRGKVIFL
jgi:hypothetical protein